IRDRTVTGVQTCALPISNSPAIVFSLVGAIVAEFVGAEAGLGMLIQSRNFSMDVAGEFAVLFILAAMGLALNAALVAVRRRVLFWDPSQKAASTGASLKGGLRT